MPVSMLPQPKDDGSLRMAELDAIIANLPKDPQRRRKKAGPHGRIYGMQDRCSYCTRRILARNMCSSHYQRWKKYGDPLMNLQTPREKVIKAWETRHQGTAA